MVPKDDDQYIAKGATLYTKGSKTKRKRKRKRINTENNYFESKRPKDEHNLKHIIELVETNGTKINFYKEKYLLRRTRSRINRNNVSSFRDYLKILKQDPNELDELMDALSINVTRFFRNNDSWEEIRNNIIPHIVRQKRNEGRSRVKIWSAGCAVGAEPYSISMIVDDRRYKDMNFTIYASDINEDLLHIARNGIYDSAYLDEMEQLSIMDYFQLAKPNTYRVKSRIKQRVKFSKIDLTRDPFPKDLDLIICRNVMIYLKRDAQDIIKKKFLTSLRANGYLILGRTETLSGRWRGQFDAVSVKHRIYQKKHSIIE